MNISIDGGERCPMCNRVAIRIVPMQDSDQKHTGLKACVDCKRKLRKGIPIEKYSRTQNEE